MNTLTLTQQEIKRRLQEIADARSGPDWRHSRERLSVSDIARHLGMPPSKLCCIQKGDIMMNCEEQARLSRVLIAIAYGHLTKTTSTSGKAVLAWGALREGVPTSVLNSMALEVGRDGPRFKRTPRA